MAGIALVLEERGLPLCRCQSLWGAPSLSGRGLLLLPEPTPVCGLPPMGSFLPWLIPPMGSTAVYRIQYILPLNQWIIPYRNLHLVNTIANAHYKRIQKVLLHLSPLVLRFIHSPFIQQIFLMLLPGAGH